MRQENYTSLEMSEQLAKWGCKLESECFYRGKFSSNEYAPRLYGRGDLIQQYLPSVPDLPAYDILNDICCRYAKEFFVDRKIQLDNGRIAVRGRCQECGSDDIETTILQYLQLGEKQRAEQYIIDNCIFNPKNK